MITKSLVRLASTIAEDSVRLHVPSTVPDKPLRLPPLPTARDLLKLYKIRAQRHLSQNFLLDHRLNNKIVTTTGKVRNCYVCEVGPGPGNISRCIIVNGAKHLTVIEKDHRFLPALELLADAANGRMSIINSDIMDFNMETIFPKKLAKDWSIEPPPFYIIGNLPFNISTPLIIKWLRHAANHTGPFAYGRTTLSLTFQKEVAQRMVAEPRSDMRCRLSVMCQYLCNVELLFTIPGRAFTPKPKVDVSLVKFTPLIKPLINQPFPLVEKLMRTVFHGRQKHCKNTIPLLFPQDRPELTKIMLEKANVCPKMSATELHMDELSGLCDVYSSLCKENEGLLDYDFRSSSRKKGFPTTDREQNYEDLTDDDDNYKCIN